MMNGETSVRLKVSNKEDISRLIMMGLQVFPEISKMRFSQKHFFQKIWGQVSLATTSNFWENVGGKIAFRKSLFVKNL